MDIQMVLAYIQTNQIRASVSFAFLGLSPRLP